MSAARRQALLWSFVLMLTAAQSLFKVVAVEAHDLRALLLHPLLWLALALYGFNTLMWVRILQLVPLSRAYLFAALTYVLVPAVGFLWFHEQLTSAYAFGSTLIVAGVLLIARA